MVSVWYFFVVKWPFLLSLISETSLPGSTNIRLHCSYKCVTSETIKSFVSRTNGSSIWNGALISIGDLSESIVIAAFDYEQPVAVIKFLSLFFWKFTAEVLIVWRQKLVILSALFVNIMHTVSWNRAETQLPSLLAGFFKLAVEFPHPNVPLTHCNPLKKASARST